MGTNDRTIGFETKEHMAIITIPGFAADGVRTNTFSYELAELCADIEMDDDVRIVIITAPEEEALSKKNRQKDLCPPIPVEKHSLYRLTLQNLLPALTGQP